MRYGACEKCGAKRPLGELLAIFDRTLCEPCADADVANRQGETLPAGAVRKQTDPTVCSSCKRDNGDRELAQLGGGVPVCADCEQRFRNPSYPTWIRTSFAALLLLAVLCTAANWRFFAAHVALRQGTRSAQAGNARGAADSFALAARRVPESRELAGLSTFFLGVALLSEDKSAAALEQLRKAPPPFTDSPQFADLLLNAEAGAAFDRKDYDEFLKKSEAMLTKYPTEPMALAAVSSAYACKWAISGEPGHKQAAIEFLDRARAAGARNPAALKDYEGRILYRLDSREILAPKEYDRRFPRGYVRSGGQQ